MNRPNAITLAALVACFAAVITGCGGGDDSPSYLKDPSSAPPIAADALSEARSEQDAVADAEKAEAANYIPTKKGKR